MLINAIMNRSVRPVNQIVYIFYMKHPFIDSAMVNSFQLVFLITVIYRVDKL